MSIQLAVVAVWKWDAGVSHGVFDGLADALRLLAVHADPTITLRPYRCCQPNLSCRIPRMGRRYSLTSSGGVPPKIHVMYPKPFAQLRRPLHRNASQREPRVLYGPTQLGPKASIPDTPSSGLP